MYTLIETLTDPCKARQVRGLQALEGGCGAGGFVLVALGTHTNTHTHTHTHAHTHTRAHTHLIHYPE